MRQIPILSGLEKGKLIGDKIQIHCHEDTDCNICNQDGRTIVCSEGPFEIVKCTNCGLVYVTPQPAESDLRDYYKNFFPPPNERTIKLWKSTKAFEQIYGLLNNNENIKPGPVLDIGMGFGEFLGRLSSNLFTHKIGVDKTFKTVSFSSAHFNHISCVVAEGEQLPFVPNSFSAITMLASLEHFKNPLRILKRVRELLAPGGIIILRVPYIEPWLAIKKKIPMLPVAFGAPRHLYDFSPATLTRILAKAGYCKVMLYPGANEATNYYAYALTEPFKVIARLFSSINRAKIFPLVGSLIAVAHTTD